MSIDFDSLATFDDWSDALQQILRQARTALQSGNVSDRVAVQDLLAEFIAKSPNRIAAGLDDIARKAMDDMLNTALSEALTSLASRTADLALHAKAISDIASNAEAKAAAIRLDKARQVIDSATSAIVSLNGLRQTLGAAADDLAVVGKIDKAVKVIQELVPLVMRVKGSPGAG